LREQNLPVPELNLNPTVTVRNERLEQVA